MPNFVAVDCSPKHSDAPSGAAARHRFSGGTFDRTLTPSRSSYVDSEFGALTDVLLCRPEHYRWADSNAMVRRASQLGRSVDGEAAQRQHAALRQALTSAGVRCHDLNPDPALGYQTYTRDAAVMTPWGLLVCQPARPERRGEWTDVVEFSVRTGWPIWQAVTAGSLEGGDVQVLRPGELLIGLSGARTSLAGAEQVSGWFAEMGWTTQVLRIPEHFLHLDVLFCALDEQRALCGVDFLEPDDVRWLEKRYELIPVSYAEVMAMAANVVALGNRRVMTSEQAGGLNRRLAALKVQLVAVDLEQFVIEGGAAHCLTMPLARDPVQSR